MKAFCLLLIFSTLFVTGNRTVMHRGSQTLEGLSIHLSTTKMLSVGAVLGG